MALSDVASPADLEDAAIRHLNALQVPGGAFLVRALGLAGTTVDFFTDDDGSVFEGDINALDGNITIVTDGTTSFQATGDASGRTVTHSLDE